MTANSCKPFSEDRTFLLLFQVVLFSNSNETSSSNFTTGCLFKACKFPLSRFTMHSHRKRTNFWARLKKLTVAFAEKRLEHLESRKILCLHRPKSQNALNVRDYKILTEQNHCLCNNVIYRLYAAAK